MALGIAAVEGGAFAPRRFAHVYIGALLAIAALAACGHAIVNEVMIKQRDAAATIDTAARQRLLSQRIALLAEDFANGNAAARTQLVAATQLMQRSHFAILRGGDLGLSGDLSASAYTLYYIGPYALDRQVSAYLAKARLVLTSNNPELRQKLAADLRRVAVAGILPQLDRSVGQLQHESAARVSRLRLGEGLDLLVLLAALGAEAVFVFRPLLRQVLGYASRLYDQATRDGLTGLANRTHFLQIAEREFLLARREGRPLAVLALDIDHFKKVNDTYGHVMGDAVLRRFAAVVRGKLRRTDVMGRTGGEEFVALLPATDLAGAAAAAEKMRAAVQADQLANLPKITVSIGVTEVEQQDAQFIDVIRRADAALYLAKNRGRNRVETAAPALTGMPQPEIATDMSAGHELPDLLGLQPATAE